LNPHHLASESIAPELSVIVPIFNEEEVLWRNMAEIAPYYDRLIGAGRWQFVLVNNGSTDGSAAIVERIVATWPASIAVRLETADYGNALRIGLAHATAPFGHIINVEQWDMPFLEWAWTARQRYDLILGSKRADPTINFQSPRRRFLSWGLNSLLSLLFEHIAADTHGPKLMKMATMRPILDQSVMSRGQFDTEFTLRAVRAGLWLAEAPVMYAEQRPPRNFMIRKILQNLFDLVRLRRLIRPLPYAGHLKFHRWSRLDVDAVALGPIEQKDADAAANIQPSAIGER